MKHLIFFFLLPATGLLFWACEEELDIPVHFDEPDATLTDTTYITEDYDPEPDEKVVFLEYFTGVRCVNCPTAMDRAEDLLDQHGDNLIVLSNHQGDWAVPFENSEFDFRNDDVNSLFSMLGSGGLPIGNIDRVDFDNDEQILYAHGNWASFVNNRIQEIPPMRIELNSEADDGDTFRVHATITYLESVNEEHRLTVVLSENNIIDLQEGPNGIIDDYEHNYIVRKYITPFNGTTLNRQPGEDDLVSGRVFEKEFRFSTDKLENTESSYITAFVHKGSNGRDVYQLNQISLLP